MRYLFQKYYLEVSAYKKGEGGINVITDNYYVDKRGRLSKERPMKENARKYGYFKGVAMCKKIQKLYDKDKWTVGLTPVREADFMNYVTKGE